MPEVIDLDQPKPIHVFEELYNLVDQCTGPDNQGSGLDRDEAEEEKDMLVIKILIDSMKANCPEHIWTQLEAIPSIAEMPLKRWSLSVARSRLAAVLEDLEKSVGMVSWKEDFGGWEVYEAFLSGEEKSKAVAYDEATAKIIIKALVA